MRILAIDHGTKRIGMAISDELGITAQPLEICARLSRSTSSLRASRKSSRKNK